MCNLDAMTEQRIPCTTTDRIDALLQQASQSLEPCAVPLTDVYEQLKTTYARTELPPETIHWRRTVLSAIETSFPEEADNLPYDPEQRENAACALVRALHLEVHCFELPDTGNGHLLYEEQQKDFERRTAGTGLIWSAMPIRVCLELRTGYRLITGSALLDSRVCCALGVSAEDIAARTPAFIAYLRAKDAVHAAILA